MILGSRKFIQILLAKRFNLLVQAKLTSTQNPNSQEYSKHIDIFENYELVQNKFQRLQFFVDRLWKAYEFPTNGDYISQLGCLTSSFRLQQCYEKMKNDPIGQQILLDKPRVNNQTVKLEQLSQLPENTFGFCYYKFMSNYNFSSEGRPKSKFINNFELAYIYQRYKEIHDFIHTLLGYGISVHDEVLVKWFEMIQLGLPSASFASLAAITKLSDEEKSDFFWRHLPFMIDNGNNSKFIMNVYFEKELETDINQLRRKLNIRPCPYKPYN